MEFLIACECGQSVTVSEGKAGSSVECGCGRVIPVPSLRALRSQGAVKSEPEVVPSRRSAGAGLGTAVLVGLLVGGSLLAFIAGQLTAFGLLVFLGGHIWLLVVILAEGSRDAVGYILWIPFFSWYFAYQRWDVCKWPVLMSAGGLLLAMLGACGADYAR